MVYNFLPFMIYPIYNTLQKMDHSLIEAAQDLGGESVAGIYQGRIPTIDAGSDERYHDGVYADHLYVLPSPSC